MRSDTLALCQALIQRPSVTPQDGGCLDLISQRLAQKGCEIERFDCGEVSNLFARFGDPTTGPLLVFVGHTDVVPPGPLDLWDSPPFTPTRVGDYLVGRGAADMKSAVAAMVTALEDFTQTNSTPKGAVGILLTSDEEGPAVNGIRHVVECFKQRQWHIDYTVVGEPSSSKQFGDTIKIGRRGSLNAELIIHGKQGHIAYPHLADNPIHRFSPALNELLSMEWDKGNADFPPTQCQVASITAGTGATNVIPGELGVKFNFRYSPEVSAEGLQQQVEDLLKHHSLKFSLHWHHSGTPFHTKKTTLRAYCQDWIKAHCDITPAFTTTGGTSDGRFIAAICDEIIEIGVCNQSIHQINERVLIQDITYCHEIYLALMQALVA